MTGQLVDVVDTGPLKGQGQGWWDLLECGHLVPYAGQTSTRRRCVNAFCQEPEDQVSIFDLLQEPE